MAIARMSEWLVPTLREPPADADLASHRLLVRAGMLRRVGEAAGIFAFLPLGRRALARVERIVRQEMDAVGGQEVVLPIVQPAELWERSGRWAVYGDEMWRCRDRHGRAYCLAPTHEEVITDLVGLDVRSWRQLPLLLYQIQNKYRDERRPRFGLLRAREFVMKDAYSFHRDDRDLERCYGDVSAAYSRIFERCGLDFRVVRADPGAIGGGRTDEFMALAEAGEAEVLTCPRCAYAADVEEAEVAAPSGGRSEPADLQRVATPGAATIDAVSAALADRGVTAERTAKILFVIAERAGPVELVAALLPGARQLNEIKLAACVGALRLRPATQEEVPVPLGFAGPVGLNGVHLVVDRAVAGSGPWVVGANVPDHHLMGAMPDRDFSIEHVADLALARPGDPCPACGAPLEGRRGIEVGQVFRLGTKYSDTLKAQYLDESGVARPMVMGCYGIGVTRTLAAVVEQHHDERGIIWPAAVAPFDCVLVPVGAGASGERARTAAEASAAEFAARGVRVILDDRDERPGVKFADADLVGFPERVTFGRDLESGRVEWKGRSEDQPTLLPVEQVAAAVAGRVHAAGGGA